MLKTTLVLWGCGPYVAKHHPEQTASSYTEECIGRDQWADKRSAGLDNIRDDRKILGLILEEADQLARDRVRWRSSVTRLLERTDLSVS